MKKEDGRKEVQRRNARNSVWAGAEGRKSGDRGSVSGVVLFKEVSPHLMSLV